MLRWVRQLLGAGDSSTGSPPPPPEGAAVDGPGAGTQSAMLALALRHDKAGQVSQAISACETVIAARPNDIEALCLLGKLLTQQGNLDRAATVLGKALALAPESLEAMLHTGRLLQKRGAYQEATRLFEAVLRKDPDSAGAHFGLGNVDLANGQLDAALARFARAIAHNPDHAEAHCNCGVAYEGKREPQRAVEAYERALAINPDLGNAHFNLARLLMARGDLQRAVHHIGKVVALDPRSADDWDIKGRLHQAMRDWAPAKEAYERALAIDPNLHEVHNNLGVVCQLLGEYDVGIRSFRAALAARPEYVAARSNLGMSLLSMGRRDEALEALRQAVHDAPGDPAIFSNYLFCISHDEHAAPHEVFEEHRQFGERFELPLRAHWPQHGNHRDPERRLKVGFVSGDLYAHAVATFIEPIWSELDAKSFELWVYANNSNEDAVTERLKSLTPHWQAVSALSDAALAQRILEDQIDILFDLSGHSAGNRLLAFARKPAPIQISWIGNPNTTGLAAMDYYLADRFGAPPGRLDALFTEKIVQLESSATFLPVENAPAVSELPALGSGMLTFGTFARSNKITEGTVALWSRVLSAVPGSRMFIGGLSDATRKQEISEQFSQHGVAADRVIYQPRTSMGDYLALHAHIDMILDTFPFGGGTTSCHALWMGVPILSLAGDTMSSRVGAVINGQVQLLDFTVESPDEFVARAVHWSRNLPQLAALRGQLRARTSASALCQPGIVTRSLEDALRQMWRGWCEGRPPRGFSADSKHPHTAA